MSTTAHDHTSVPTRHDTWIRHFGRYLGVSLLVGMSCLVAYGLVWSARIYSRTGYRRRDLLLSFVPVVGAIVSVRATWRYTARTPYWTPRDDRPSSTMEPGRQVKAAAAGYALATVYYALVGLVVAGAPAPGWAEADRAAVVAVLESEGLDPATASCVVNELEAQYVEAPAAWDDAFQREFEAALTTCWPQ